MSLFTIYIVDDEELIHNSLRSYIRRNFPDVEIVPFFSAVMFIRYLKKHNVENSLVILDHHFDIGISGSEAVGEIRRISKTLPIIFLTGVTDDSDITYIY